MFEAFKTVSIYLFSFVLLCLFNGLLTTHFPFILGMIISFLTGFYFYFPLVNLITNFVNSSNEEEDQ